MKKIINPRRQQLAVCQSVDHDQQPKASAMFALSSVGAGKQIKAAVVQSTSQG